MARRADAELIETLEAARIHPLWDRYKKITPVLPDAPDGAAVWRWREIEPFAERAAREVAVEDIERRALILAHPAFGGETVTTTDLIAAFTVLEPGDRAVPHRHTASAIRFATRAEGAVTIVNGRRCAMLEGDLVLTPPMCWHGHINEGGERTVWFDAANIPLVNALHANFFEPGSRGENAFWEVDEGDERLWRDAGLQAEGHGHEAAHSPKYRYPGAATRRLLDAALPGADGAKTVRYANPLTGGPVMPSLDCYAKRLIAGEPTRSRRMLCSQVCLAVSGAGRSTIGDET
ncbi:MAG: cupin domain-containing protein, partial [Defluviicoccus sp.]|nr:cupin domain-containing protein [Defluviicoccus sp.]